MIDNLELLGWFGIFLFTVSCIPQIVKIYKEGHAEGLSWWMLILWFFGEITTLIYVVIGDHLSGIWHWPLIVNYAITGIFVAIMIKYKIWPVNKDKGRERKL